MANFSYLVIAGSTYMNQSLVSFESETLLGPNLIGDYTQQSRPRNHEPSAYSANFQVKSQKYDFKKLLPQRSL